MSINDDIMTLVSKSEAKETKIVVTETDLKRKFNKIADNIEKIAKNIRVDARPENMQCVVQAAAHMEAAMRAYQSKSMDLNSRVAIAMDCLADAERCFN